MSTVLRRAATLLCFLTTAASLDIDSSDGGYKDIWVSISERVPYNESIIENIKALFRSSSEFLHKATNGRVHFKHVTIEAPKTWPKRGSARALSSGFFERSDVRVDQPTALHGDRPFTVQKRRCGEPGDYIQVTPAFLATIGNSTANKLENAAYVMVHQWAHYRYGVFDEYGNADDKRYPLTYCDRGKVKLNACSNRIAFTARRADGGKCEINDKCLFAKDCVVTVQQPSGNPVESSIMFMPYLANYYRRLDFLKEAATRYIGDIEDGSLRLAIIEFSYSAKVVHTLMPVNVNTRAGFLNATRGLKAQGATCIGCGLEKALELLNTANETPEGATILLMSDGEENVDPPIVEVLPRVVASKAVVSTLALGATADHSLKKLATSTRGKAFAFRDLQENIVDELESAFVSSTMSQHDSVPRAHTLVESEEEFTSLLEKKFQVDSNVRNGTVVHVTRNRPETGKIEAWLTDPSGQRRKEWRGTVNANDVVIFIASPAKVSPVVRLKEKSNLPVAGAVTLILLKV
ncbi:calcium-activated chloride channel regulator 4A-like [Dermacentor albipictus]|uniref:calcium-activated chloride channel regulator 4A-like n=1 Tax=Dermacentor albipictus TaxID=60249 RepID=UPI0038FBFFCC